MTRYRGRGRYPLGPKPQCLYRFRRVDTGELLYLGRTNSLPARTGEHNNDRRKFVWWRWVHRVEVQHLPPGTTEAQADRIERQAIAAERPLFNKNPGRFDWAAYRRAEREWESAHGIADTSTVLDQAAWTVALLASMADRAVAAVRTWAVVTAVQVAMLAVLLVAAGWAGVGPLGA